MSDRDRWIVYPLLFLALGISLHDKIVPSKVIKTHRVMLYNDDEDHVFEINGTSSSAVNLHATEPQKAHWLDIEALLNGRSADDAAHPQKAPRADHTNLTR